MEYSTGAICVEFRANVFKEKLRKHRRIQSESLQKRSQGRRRCKLVFNKKTLSEIVSNSFNGQLIGEAYHKSKVHGITGNFIYIHMPSGQHHTFLLILNGSIKLALRSKKTKTISISSCMLNILSHI